MRLSSGLLTIYFLAFFASIPKSSAQALPPPQVYSYDFTRAPWVDGSPNSSIAGTFNQVVNFTLGAGTATELDGTAAQVSEVYCQATNVINGKPNTFGFYGPQGATCPTQDGFGDTIAEIQTGLTGASQIDVTAKNGVTISETDLNFSQVFRAPSTPPTTGTFLQVIIGAPPGQNRPSCMTTDGTLGVPVNDRTVQLTYNFDPTSLKLLCNGPIQSIFVADGGGGMGGAPAGSTVFGIQNATFSVEPFVPSLQVVDPSFVQVVARPQLPSNGDPNVFDAVLGKSASFNVFLKPSNLAGVVGTVVVRILSGSIELTSTDLIPISKIVQNTNADGAYVVGPERFLKVFTPTGSGPMPLTVRVDTTLAPSIQTEDYTKISLNVHQVTAPIIGFAQLSVQSMCKNSPTPLTCAEDYQPAQDNVSRLQTSTGAFMSAAFPVPDNSYPNSTYSATAQSAMGVDPSAMPSLNLTTLTSALGCFTDSNVESSIQGCKGYLAMAQDAANLTTMAEKSGLSRIVGIVSDQYFPDHFFTAAAGMSFAGQKSVFVIESDNEAIPHELAHSFGQPLEAYCSLVSGCGGIPEGHYTNVPILGYDATTSPGTGYTWSPFPNPFYPDAHPAWSIMAGDGDFPPGTTTGSLGNPQASNYFNYWMDNTTYGLVFQTISTLPPGDPQTLLVSGILTEDGHFYFSQAANLPNGVVTVSSSASDVSISTIDATGNMIDAVGLQSNFTAIVKYGPGQPVGPAIVDLGAMPVVVQLPANSAIESIQVVQNNQVLTKSSLNSQLVMGIISSIPPNAFKEPETCKRSNSKDEHLQTLCQNYVSIDQKILSERAKKIQTRLDSGKSQSAIGKLRSLVETIRDLTLENYSVAGASELTQKQVIDDLDGIIKTLKDKVHQRANCKGENVRDLDQ